MGERNIACCVERGHLPVLTSKLDPRSEDFQAGSRAMRLLVGDLNAQAPAARRG